MSKKKMEISDILENLEQKLTGVVDEVKRLRQENEKLRKERDFLRSKIEQIIKRLNEIGEE